MKARIKRFWQSHRKSATGREAESAKGWIEDIGQSARVSHLNDRVNIINRNRKLGFLWGEAT